MHIWDKKKGCQRNLFEKSDSRRLRLVSISPACRGAVSKALYAPNEIKLWVFSFTDCDYSSVQLMAPTQVCLISLRMLQQLNPYDVLFGHKTNIFAFREQSSLFGV